MPFLLKATFLQCGAVSFSCSHSYLLSLSKVWLLLTSTFIPSHDLVIWTHRSVHFFLAKAALVTLSTARFVALRPPFLLWHNQFVEVFPLKLVPFCKLSAGLGNINNSATSLFS